MSDRTKPGPAGDAVADVGRELAGQLSLSVLRAARVLRQLGNDQLSITQGTALAMIETYGPVTISELASREQVARPTASAVVSRLEELGFVVRLDDPDDGRICWLKITRSGRAHLRATRSRRTDWLMTQLANRTEAEMASLHTAIGILNDIHAGFGSDDGRAGPRA